MLLISTNIKTIQVETLRRNHRETYNACLHLRLYTTSVHETLLPLAAPTPTLPHNVLGGIPVVSPGFTAALLTRIVLGMMRDLERVLQHVLSRSFLLGRLARSTRPYICRGWQGWSRTSDPPCRPCGVRSRRNPSREKFVRVLGCQVVGRRGGKVDLLIRSLGLLNEGLRKGAYFEVRMGG